MAHEVETMMSARHVPWHGLGKILADSVTSSEAIVEAGLDWEVVERDLYFTVRDDEEEFEVKTAGGRHKALVRETDNSCLGIVGNRYGVLQNRAAFNFLDGLVEGADEPLKYETAGSLKNGRVVWMLAKLTNRQLEVVSNDAVEEYLLLTNSHDGSQSVTVMWTPVRVVCNNTLTWALNKGKKRVDAIRVRHTTNVETLLEEKAKVLGFAGKCRDEFAEFAEAAKNLQFADYLDDFLNEIMPLPEDDKSRAFTIRTTQRTKIMDLFENGAGQEIKGVAGTAWAAYNAVTEYATHDRVAATKTRQQRMQSVMLGSSRKFTLEATEVLQNMVRLHA